MVLNLAQMSLSRLLENTTSNTLRVVHTILRNRFAERAVKTIKQVLLKSPKDPYLAVLSYRATPLSRCGRSPSELLMGRKVRTTLPLLQQQLVPEWNFLSEFEQKDKVHKRKQKENFDTRHRVKELSKLQEDDLVFVKTGKQTTSGTTASSLDTPRSYEVNTPTGQVRRNRQYLIKSASPQQNVLTLTPVHLLCVKLLQILFAVLLWLNLTLKQSSILPVIMSRQTRHEKGRCGVTDRLCHSTWLI